jgi:hypothetical protein
VGLHYRGLSSLRETEASFRRRETPVLVATSGLAQGVNLPARAVIVRDNVFGIDPISVADATQMLGRVGRQGFEEEGYGFLITPRTEVATWRRNLREGYPVRSRIIETLADHILADILLGRITSTGDLRAWYEGTLAYHQDGGATERLEMALADLLSGGFVVSSGPPEENLSCTELGRLTSRFLVEVAAAKGLIDDLRAAPMPSEPAAAERAVLLAAATSVAGLRDSPVPSRAQGELSALLASSGLGAVPESTPWGSKKTLLAAHMCLTDPPLVAGPHPIGPFPTVELRDLAGELTRYLGWLAAAGRATLLGWPVAIAGDLASRIEFRTARPPRGAGRLLRMIEAAVPAEHRPQRVPVQFRQHQSSGVGCPEDLKARSAGGVHPAFEGVDIEITSVEARGSELRVALKATAGDLSVSCRAHAGGAASAVWDQHWDGAELAVPLPHGASAGAVAVDVMAFGRRDWGYAGGVWSVQVDVEVHERRARELIELLPVSAVAARGLARFMGGGRRRRRDAAAILRDPQPYLQPLAAHLGREGTIPEVVARLEEALGRLLAPAEGLDMRPPANVLLSGTADTCERDVVLAALLQCLGHKTGVAELPSGRLAALVRTDQGWRAVCQPAELASGHLRGIIPKQPGVVATLGRPPTTVRGPVAPTLVFLGQYRRVGSEPRG